MLKFGGTIVEVEGPHFVENVKTYNPPDYT